MDKNTHVFQREKKNKIFDLENQDDNWITNIDGVANHLVNHFIELLKQDTNEDNYYILFKAPIQIDVDSNNNIAHIPTSKEILFTIKRMKSLKSPGPDGIPTLFYKRC